VGRVVRPHGLKGQVIVEMWTNRPERTRDGAVFSTGDRQIEVLASSPMSESGGRDRWLMTFAGVTDRQGAERLRDAVLQAPPLDEPGALWVDELIGAEVFDAQGSRLGLVEAVEPNPASDLLVLDGGHLVPLRFVVSAVDGVVTVDIPAGLLET